MIFKKTVLLASAILIALAFSGCSKKPRRPNPLDTVMGQGSASGAQDSGGYINPQDMGGEAGLYDLQSRSASGDGWADQARRGVLPTVFFNFDSASIQPQERSKIDQAAEHLRSNPNARLVLEGHCDWRGTTEYNMALGDRRAKSVADYLQTLGISQDRMLTRSKGDLDATEGATSAQMAEERKVEILVAD